MMRTLLDQLHKPGAIRVEFQPILDVHNNETHLYALEALARGPAGTSLEKPDVLFEYARRKGEESRLDLLVIAEVFAATASLPFDPCVSINIHGSTLSNIDRFAEKFLSSAASHQIDPRRLMLEIVEHRSPWTMDTFRATLSTLREAGVRVAVDDLGIGASNFRMIVDCRPDHLKVDRYIVHGCSKDRFRSAVLESIVTLADAIDAAPIAEGVEDCEDLAVITALGIDLVQGWLYAPSMPAQAIAALPYVLTQQPAMKGFCR
jgi:EAL domain-containing protein (putative c-di-GMP-specific phosphodiesterase class I)